MSEQRERERKRDTVAVADTVDENAGASLFEDDENEEKLLAEAKRNFKNEQGQDAVLPEAEDSRFQFRADSEEFYLQERAGEWAEE